jgi:PIN domain
MIVIDANELRRIPRAQHRLWRLLCELAKGSGHTIATADITFEEFKSGYSQLVRDAWMKRRDADLAYREYDGSGSSDFDDADADLGAVVTRGLAEFQGSITILVSDPAFHTEGLRREVWRQRPAAISWAKPGSGARDVVLWLTAMQVCKSSGERLYFVSDDVLAFGKSELHEELKNEIEEKLGARAGEFFYCRNIAELLPLLADRSDHVEDIPSLELLAKDKTLNEHVDRFCEPYFRALTRRMAGTYTDHLSMFSMKTIRRLTLSAVCKASSYRIGGKVWLVASMRWQLDARVNSISVTKDAASIESDYSGSILEEVYPGFAQVKTFDLTAIISVSHDSDSMPEIESVDIVSARLADQ